MIVQPRTAVKIGNSLCSNTEDASLPGCRLPAQHKAVMNWHHDNPSVYWCYNPFRSEPDGRVYKCTFWHYYVGDDGYLHTLGITPTGRVKHIRITKEYETGRGGTRATARKYGVFRG